MDIASRTRGGFILAENTYTNMKCMHGWYQLMKKNHALFEYEQICSLLTHFVSMAQSALGG
jgi:hypothetical protein